MTGSTVLSLDKQVALGIQAFGYQLADVVGHSCAKSGYKPGDEPLRPGFGILFNSDENTLGEFVAVFWFEKTGNGWKACAKNGCVIEVKGRSNLKKMQDLATELSHMCGITISVHVGNERSQREQP